MINVRLHGHIGQTFVGNLADGSWLLSVRTPQEAIKAIEANRPGIFRYLVDSAKHGVEYRVLLDGESFHCLEELYLARDADYETIDIIPEIIGASSGSIWEIIAGVVLIIVGVILSETGVGEAIAAWGIGLTAGSVAVIAGAVIGAGLSLAIGGIEGLIFKPPQASSARNKPSYLFSGQVNSTGQGGPIPVLYGEMIVGSQLVSAYLTTIEVDPKTGEPVSSANDPDTVGDDVAGDPAWDALGARASSGSSIDAGFNPSVTTGDMAGGGGTANPSIGGGEDDLEEEE